jgi:hypothetical protein
LSIIAILIVGFPVSVVINSIYLNLYKIKEKPSFFFIVNLMILIC